MSSQDRSGGKISSIHVRLSLPADKYLAYYQGQVQFIQVRSHDGRNIRFPASAVRKFLTPEGIYGEFEIQIDQNNKLLGVSRKEE